MKISHKGYIDIELTTKEASCLTLANQIIETILDKLSDYDITNYTATDILDQFYYEHKISIPVHEESSISED